MSAMQKAIRRGREDLALNAVATLLRDAPEKPRRRIGFVAYEDVGGPKCRVIAGVFSFVADDWPHEGNVSGMAASGLVMASPP
jgi:replication-associated recombination protein RarA